MSAYCMHIAVYVYSMQYSLIITRCIGKSPSKMEVFMEINQFSS